MGMRTSHQVYSEEIERLAKVLGLPREEVDRRVAQGRASAEEKIRKSAVSAPRSDSRSPAERVSYELGRLEATGMPLEKAFTSVSKFLPNATAEYERVRSSGGENLERLNAAFRAGASAALGFGADLEGVEATALAKNQAAEDFRTQPKTPAGIPWGALTAWYDGYGARSVGGQEGGAVLAAFKEGRMPSVYRVTFGHQLVTDPSEVNWSGFENRYGDINSILGARQKLEPKFTVTGGR